MSIAINSGGCPKGADCNGDGAISGSKRRHGMKRVSGNFDKIDATKDGKDHPRRDARHRTAHRGENKDARGGPRRTGVTPATGDSAGHAPAAK